MLKQILAALAVTALAAGSLTAAPLNPKNVPAKAKWVVHVDVERVQSTQLGAKMMASADKEMKAAAECKALLEKYNFDMKRDMKDVTLYGTDYPDFAADMAAKMAGGKGASTDGMAAVIHMTFEPAKLLQDAKALPGYQEEKYGAHTIVSLPSPDAQGGLQVSKDAWGCFSKNQLVAGPSAAAVKAALDVLDGKAACLKPGAPGTEWLGKSTAGALFVAADKLKELREKNAQENAEEGGQQMPKVEAFRLAVDEVAGENGGNLKCEAVVQAETPEAAQQLQQLVQMFMAMAAMQLQSEEQPAEGTAPSMSPEQKKAISQILSSISATAEAQNLKVTMNAPLSAVLPLVDEAAKKAHEAAGQIKEETKPAGK